MKRGILLSYLCIVALVSISVFFVSSKAKASSVEDITVTISPQNPTPNENTTITLSSYAYDLNSVPVSWSVNGKKTSSGIGDKSISLTAPASGSKADIIATVTMPDGNLVIPITVQSSVMILLWQAEDSYVPPFYEGKALPSPGSKVEVIAMPQVKNISPQSMVYAWKIDYTNDQTNSGYGKNTYTYDSDYLDSSNNIDVTASSIDQSYSSETNINLYTVPPKIDFYKYDTSIGTIWDQALSNGHQINGDEIIQAAPYFISPKDLRIPFLTFNWSINGSSVATSTFNKNLFPLKAQAGVSGTSTIGLNISSSVSIVESANKEITVNF